MSRLITLLWPALLPVCLFAGTPEKQDKPGAVEKAGGIPVEDIQVYGIWAIDRSATVLLTDSSGKNIIRLGFEPDKNGSKLISASIEPGGETIKVVAMLDGKERTLIRPIAAMPLPDKDLMLTSLRQAVAQAEKDIAKKSPDAVPRRGPTEEDRQRYESLSEEARQAFREGMRKIFADPAFRDGPEEKRREAIRALFDKTAKEAKKD